MNVFLDFDGPILDVSSRYYEAYNRCLKELGYRDVLAPYVYWQHKRDRVANEEILRATGAEKCVAEFSTRWKALIEAEDLLRLDQVWPDVREFLSGALPRHRACLVTLRTYPERTRLQVKWLGIQDWFESILSSPATPGAERWRKKVEMVESLASDWTEPEGSIFVGDTDTDILAGKYMDMYTIGVTFGIRAREHIASCAPNALVDTPQALVKHLGEMLQ